jgi:asparagine N-glycosylation enzyme membrane subunit Stt3
VECDDGWTTAERKQRIDFTEVIAMLWTIFVILVVLWALGLATSYTLGGFIHILLVLAIVSVLIRVIQGRRIA